ncbi:transglutaminase family protein [Bacteroidota bacterium]
MNLIRKILLGIGMLTGLIIIGTIIYALPAMVTLPSGPRSGIEELTIADAAKQIREDYPKGWQQIERARQLVGERMDYCYQNAYDSYEKAFTRGLGFCQQEAHALAAILRELGYDAWVVQSVKTRFEDGNILGHSWVRVSWNGITKDIDPELYDPETGALLFEPLGQVTEFSTFFRIFSGWGSAAVNAHRYYFSE